jgi:hypothetical protein
MLSSAREVMYCRQAIQSTDHPAVHSSAWKNGKYNARMREKCEETDKQTEEEHNRKIAHHPSILQSMITNASSKNQVRRSKGQCSSK